MENKKPILSVSKLNKFFVKSGKIVKVLDDINFDVYAKDFFGIIGESGSGKSTTGKCIIRLYTSSSGTITFDDKIINQKRMSKQSRLWLPKNMSMIFQDPMSSLNPRKNVLSLISEPLLINRTIANDASTLINKYYQTNPYFQNTFKLQDFNLTKQYLLPFYKQNITLFENFIKTLKGLKTSKENTNEVLSQLLDLETEYKESMSLVSKFTDELHDLIETNWGNLTKGKVHKTEVDYYNTEKTLKIQEKYLQAPKAYWDLANELKALEDSLTNYLLDSKYKYKEQNLTRLNSIRNSLKSEIKALTQECKLTNSITDYILKSTNLLVLKDTAHALKAVGKKVYLEAEDVEEFSKFITSKIQSKYKDVLADISKLVQMSQDLDKLSLEDTAEEVITKHFQDYKVLYDSIQNQSQKLKDTDFVLEDKSVAAAVTNVVNISTKINAKISERSAKYEADIEALKAKMQKMKAEYNIEQAKKNPDFQKATADFAKAKSDRAEFVTADNAAFNYEKLPEIKAQSKLIKELDNVLYELQIKLKRAITEKLQEFEKEFENLEIAPELVFKDKIKEWLKVFNKSEIENKTAFEIIEKNIVNKLVGITAINFELSTYLSDVNLCRHLRAKNKAVLIAFRKQLKNMITRNYVYEALDEVGLKSEHAYRYPHEFSGGQRQRIVIARALIAKPKLIIADEPISALDVSIQAQVINIMRSLAQKHNITFLFIAHDLSMVRYVSNRLIIMHKGRIVEKGDTNEIFNNPVHPYTKSLIKASPELSKIHVDLASFSAKLDYDKRYTTNNVPTFFSVSDTCEHFVFATKDQIARWKK